MTLAFEAGRRLGFCLLSRQERDMGHWLSRRKELGGMEEGREGKRDDGRTIFAGFEMLIPLRHEGSLVALL